MPPVAPTYTTTDYQAKFLAPQVRVTRRVEILEANGQTLWAETADNDPRLISGSVSVDYSRDERRSLDLQLANFDRKLVHRPEGFWYDKVLRVYRGIRFNDGFNTHNYEISLGKFMIDRVQQPRYPRTVKITARDYTKKALLSKFTEALSFAKNTLVTDVIAALAANAGIFDRILPASAAVLGSDTAFERGTSRWEAMKQIATAFNYELFFDANGYLVMREFIDPTLGPISYTFQTGQNVGNLVDWDKSTNDTRIFNHVSVMGVTDGSLPVRADAVHDVPGSPTAVSRIGRRVLPFESSIVTTTPQAQALADSLLSVNMLEEYEINMSSLVVPWLEAGEIVKFLDPEALANEPDRFLLTSFNIPLGLEAMSAVGRRVTIIGYDYGV
jgi:hypothetical protein